MEHRLIKKSDLTAEEHRRIADWIDLNASR